MIERDDLQESLRCPECGEVGSLGGVGVTGGPSSWTGLRFRAMYCEPCEVQYYHRLRTGPPSPS